MRGSENYVLHRFEVFPSWIKAGRALDPVSGRLGIPIGFSLTKIARDTIMLFPDTSRVKAENMKEKWG